MSRQRRGGSGCLTGSRTREGTRASDLSGIAVSCSTPSPACALKRAHQRRYPALRREPTKPPRTSPSGAKSPDVLGPYRFNGTLHAYGPGGPARGHFSLSDVSFRYCGPFRGLRRQIHGRRRADLFPLRQRMRMTPSVRFGPANRCGCRTPGARACTGTGWNCHRPCRRRRSCRTEMSFPPPGFQFLSGGWNALRTRVHFDFHDVLRSPSKAVKYKFLFEHRTAEPNDRGIWQSAQFIDEVANGHDRRIGHYLTNDLTHRITPPLANHRLNDSVPSYATVVCRYSGD